MRAWLGYSLPATACAKDEGATAQRDGLADVSGQRGCVTYIEVITTAAPRWSTTQTRCLAVRCRAGPPGSYKGADTGIGGRPTLGLSPGPPWSVAGSLGAIRKGPVKWSLLV